LACGPIRPVFDEKKECGALGSCGGAGGWGDRKASAPGPGRRQSFPTPEQKKTTRIIDPERAKKYARILYNQALLIAGLPIDDPSGYTDLLCSLWK
jgi:hypothetical protein